MAKVVIKNHLLQKMINIKIQPDLFVQYKNGNILSKIYLEIENVYFPEKEWVDFSVIIMTWWIDEILKIEDNYGEIHEFFFMDGLFKFTLSKDTDKWIMLLYNDDIVVAEYHNIKIDDFINQVNKATNALLKSIDKKDFVVNKDIVYLNRLHRTLLEQKGM